MSDADYYSGLRNGLADGKTEERARIVALIRDHIERWQSGEYFAHELEDYDDTDEVVALKRLLRQVEETSHE